jgi:hypothetical protein
MKAFETRSGFSGYVHETMVINGQIVFVNERQLKMYLREYYNSPVTFMSSTEAPERWTGSPSQWASQIEKPTPTLPWWEGRLSINESNADGIVSGRQPRMELTATVLHNLKSPEYWGLMF